MARYDIYNAVIEGGYLLDVQSDLLEGLNTRVVVPLLPAQLAPKPAERLNPEFEIDGSRYVMVTQFLSSVPVSVLKSPVDNLSVHHDEIVSAIDMLTQGF